MVPLPVDPEVKVNTGHGNPRLIFNAQKVYNWNKIENWVRSTWKLVPLPVDPEV